MPTRFAKAFYFLSVMFFVIAFLYIYASLPESVVYEMGDGASPAKQLSKDSFFFTAIAAFVILNLMVILPAKMIENHTVPRLRILFKTGDPFREQMLSWVYSFSGVLNISLLIMAFYMVRLNNPDGIGQGGIGFIFYLIPLFFVLWVVALFVILGKKMKQTL
jgi:hypothetical protein